MGQRALVGAICRSILAVAIAGLAACSSAPRDLPAGAIESAFITCGDDCTDLAAGPSTRKLPYAEADGIFGRWCVEITFTRGRAEGQAAVIVEKFDPNDDSGLSWVPRPATFNADCGEER